MVLAGPVRRKPLIVALCTVAEGYKSRISFRAKLLREGSFVSAQLLPARAAGIAFTALKAVRFFCWALISKCSFTFCPVLK